jgi:hypothetical protein
MRVDLLARLLRQSPRKVDELARGYNVGISTIRRATRAAALNWL